MNVYEHPTWLGFIKDIAENPADDEIRLIAADWLEENRKGERANLIRQQIKNDGVFYWNGDMSTVEEISYFLPGYMIRSRCAAFYRRGFVQEWRLSGKGFIRHWKTIKQQFPAQYLRLTSVPPIPYWEVGGFIVVEAGEKQHVIGPSAYWSKDKICEYATLELIREEWPNLKIEFDIKRR